MFNEACKKITSLQNPLIGHWTKLRLHSKYREEKKSVLVCGDRVVLELLSSLSPSSLVVSENALLDLPPLSCPLYSVNCRIMEKISGLAAGIGLVAEFPLPPPTSLVGKRWILALDNLQDPGNLGTLVRTAVSLGWEGLFLLGDGCDLFNDKVLRASRGGSLLMPYTFGDYVDLSSLGLKIYIAHTQGRELTSLPPLQEGILLLSNESQGVKEKVKTLGEEITIPISNKMESLNVAVAGSILMHYLKCPK